MGDVTISKLKKKAVDSYNAAYEGITGTSAAISDESKAILYAAAQIFYQLAETIDLKARQNLLKYSTGSYLDNIGMSRPGSLTRKAAEYAIVTVRFTLSAKRQNIVAIPRGTRVTGGNGTIYFAVTEYTEIAPGEEYADVQCVALTGGTEANRFGTGEINILVDPIAYIASVANTEEPTGGTDIESDDDFANRIYSARNLYSTTGAENAYIYYTKAFSTLIDDVIITNPADAKICIYILMADREQATSAFIDELTAYLDDPDKRPLTDKIAVKNVNRVVYSINVEYEIYENDISKLAEIEKAVTAAAEKYKTWQSAKIGRDINPQKLISMLIEAGAAKVTINSPTDTRVMPEEVAYCSGTTLEYKGYVEE
jgi:phage-related baseplate assembly protein